MKSVPCLPLPKTFENVALRFLTGDTHPDHDSILLRGKRKRTSLPPFGVPPLGGY
jgi:hypothetical protein